MLTQIASQLQKIVCDPHYIPSVDGLICASLERLAAVLAQQQALESESMSNHCARRDGASGARGRAAGAATTLALSSHALAAMDAANPIVPGARLGREPDGRPAWFIADPARAGRFLKVGT
jgi:hypothetical protein